MSTQFNEADHPRSHGKFAHKQQRPSSVSLFDHSPTTDRIMVKVELQEWDNNTCYPVKTTEFDATSLLKDKDESELNLVLDNFGDNLFHEAMDAGIIDRWHGPFEVDVDDLSEKLQNFNPDASPAPFHLQIKNDELPEAEKFELTRNALDYKAGDTGFFGVQGWELQRILNAAKQDDNLREAIGWLRWSGNDRNGRALDELAGYLLAQENRRWSAKDPTGSISNVQGFNDRHNALRHEADQSGQKVGMNGIANRAEAYCSTGSYYAVVGVDEDGTLQRFVDNRPVVDFHPKQRKALEMEAWARLHINEMRQLTSALQRGIR